PNLAPTTGRAAPFTCTFRSTRGKTWVNPCKPSYSPWRPASPLGPSGRVRPEPGSALHWSHGRAHTRANQAPGRIPFGDSRRQGPVAALRSGVGAVADVDGGGRGRGHGQGQEAEHHGVPSAGQACPQGPKAGANRQGAGRGLPGA